MAWDAVANQEANPPVARTHRASHRRRAVVVVLAVVALVATIVVAGPVIRLMRPSVDLDVAFSDPGLAECVAEALNSKPGDRVSKYALSQLTSLKCREGTIRSLFGIDRLSNLEELDLSGQDSLASGLSPVADLPRLETLNIDDTGITDLSALSGLGSLRALYMSQSLPVCFGTDTDLSDFHYDLGGLTFPDLGRGTPVDLEPLRGLTSLRVLKFQCRYVRSISALEGMTELEELDLGFTPVEDLTPVSGMIALQEIWLDYTWRVMRNPP